jgi:peptide methionine sulfoxide reductase MsrB
VVGQGHVILKEDHSHGMHRLEGMYSQCESYLGRVFDADHRKQLDSDPTSIHQLSFHKKGQQLIHSAREAEAVV